MNIIRLFSIKYINRYHHHLGNKKPHESGAFYCKKGKPI
jgi:hypothetical protein